MQAAIKGRNPHRLLCVDSGAEQILEFAPDGTVETTVPTIGAAFEVWRLGNTYLYSHLGREHHGVCLVDADGRILREYRTDSEVFTCQPTADGGVLIGELTSKRLIWLAEDWSVRAAIPIRSAVSGHEVMRMARQQPDGSFLVVHPGDCCIRQYTPTGNLLREVPTRPDTFAAHNLPNGHLVYTAQTTIIEVDTAGHVVWEADADDLAAIAPRWLTGLEVLPDGSYVVCNWLGHGCEGQGAPLFGINRQKEILWQLYAPEFTRNIANVKVLP